MLRIRLEAYPFAKFPNPILAGMGITGGYAQGLPLNSQTADGEKLTAKWSEWDVNFRVQYRPKTFMIGAEAGLASQKFVFSADANSVGTLLDEVPTVNYRVTRFGADVGSELAPKVFAYVGAGYRLVQSFGPELQEKFLKTKVTSFDLKLGGSYAISQALSVLLRVNATFYSHTFVLADNMNEAAGSDRLINASAAVGYSF